MPEHLRKTVCKELHEEMGHLGSERVIDLTCERFFWPRMRQDITHYVTKVCPWLKSKKPPINPREPLHPIVTTAPFQMVAIDYLHLETCAGGYQYILVVMDHFARYAQAYAMRDKSAKTAADKLYNDFIPRYGFPQKIHHDQGAEFENKLFYNLEKLSGIKHSRTTHDNVVTLGGYNIVRRDRINKLHGRVCIYIKDSIHYTAINELADTSFEALWVHLHLRRLPWGFRNLVVGALYHPPRSDNAAMLDYLSNCLSYIESHFSISPIRTS